MDAIEEFKDPESSIPVLEGIISGEGLIGWGLPL